MPSGQPCLEVFVRRAATIQARKLIERESRRRRNIPARSCATKAHRDHAKIDSPRQTLKVVRRMLRLNGWTSLVNRPVKSEMPVAAPKSQAKEPIQLD